MLKNRDSCPRISLSNSRDFIWPRESLPALTEAIQDLQQHSLGCDRLLHRQVQASTSHKANAQTGQGLQGYLPNSYST